MRTQCNSPDRAVLEQLRLLDDGDGSVHKIDVAATERLELAEAQRGEGCGEDERPEARTDRFGKVVDLLSELLPISGARNAGTVRNRTLRVGAAVVQPRPVETASPTSQAVEPIVVGLDGG